MKNYIYLTLIALTALITLQSFDTIKLGKRDGTEPGYTGSPGDSLKNCTICHGGTATYIDGWITSDIPATGYVPGARYTIKATNTEFSGTRFGFLVSPQDSIGNLLGELVITDTVTTKLVGNNKYVTYTINGVESIDSLSWYFDWIAPADSINEVIFYGAFNSNFEGHKEGDQTTLSRLRVYKQGFTGIKETNITNVVFAFPNPVTDLVNIQVPHAINQSELMVFDSQGKRVFRQTLHNNHKVDLNQLPKGLYLLQLNVGTQTYTQKIVKL